jgi:sugar lactone lactonase YvrE
MNVRSRVSSCLLALAAAQGFLCQSLALAASDVSVNDTDVYPESITATADGTVIVGSHNKPIIYRARHGETAAQPWIHLIGEATVTTFGVLADSKSKTLWVCESHQKNTSTTASPRHSVLRTFDLETGEAKESWPLPGDTNLCNDIAIAADGTAYISDTTNGQILRLRRRGQLEVWLKDSSLAGIDGLTFVGPMLYVDSVTQSTLLRVAIKKDGSPEAPVTIALSQPLSRPDGLRAQAGRLFVAENGASRVSELQLHGDAATVAIIKAGYVTPTAVQPVGTVLWVGDAKFAYLRDPKLQGQDPGPFKVYAVPLPK